MNRSAAIFSKLGLVLLLAGCGGKAESGQATTTDKASGGTVAAGGSGISGGTNSSPSGGGVVATSGGGSANVATGGSASTAAGGNASLGGSGGTTDGVGAAGQGSICRTCTPNNCGQMDDACGSFIDCGTCPVPVQCGVVEPNICGDVGGHCIYFCLDQVPTCPAGSATLTTTVNGTVWAPSGNPPIDTSRGEGSLPIPNALVYVPNASKTSPYGLSPFVDGTAAGTCECEVQGNPIVYATTSVDGSFTLTNVPVGANIPLVIQLGRWRRVITIPRVAACATTTLKAEQTRLPRRQAEGHPMDAIPKMAISTGDTDAMECLLRKMGVEDSQFSNPGGTGRIQFYQDNGGICTDGGGACSGTTPNYLQLTANQATIDQYDAAVFPCRAAAHDIAVADKQRVINAADSYVNKGGRAYFTHFSYSWLYRNDAQPPTSTNLPWTSKTNTNGVNGNWTTEFGAVDTSFPRGRTFADWLALPVVNGLTAATPVPYVTIDNVYRDMNNPVNWDSAFGANATPVPLAERWLYAYNSIRNPSDAIFHVTYDAPWGAPLEERCGRVLYSSFHVTGATTRDVSFPTYCTNMLTATEKVLAYLMLDMTSCVGPAVLSCVPQTCAEQGITCGLAGDGCGRTIDCGTCCVPYQCGVNTPWLSFPVDPNNPDASCPMADGCGGRITCACID